MMRPEEDTRCDERTEDFLADLGNAEKGRSLQNALPHPQPLAPSSDSMRSEIFEMASANTGAPTHNTLHDVTSSHSPTPSVTSAVATNPEDIGVPTDGEWETTVAYDFRFCVQHEEDEWLLESVDRWMYPSDFNTPEAAAVLEAKLRNYKSKAYSLQKYHQASRAECDDTLWSQIDTPIKRGKFRDQVIYLIRWKLFWTPQSHILDMEWVRSSFRAQNKHIGRRCSGRVEKMAEKMAPERAAKRQAMMAVVNLEDLF
jgi:hypothetical protein